MATLVGPALGTALVLGIGAGEAFAFDAITFALSVLLVVRVQPRARGQKDAPAGESILQELRAGYREVRSRTWVWVLIVVFTGPMLCVYARWYALAPQVARDSISSSSSFPSFTGTSPDPTPGVRRENASARANRCRSRRERRPLPRAA